MNPPSDSRPGPSRIAPLAEPDWDARLDGVRERLAPVLNVHRVMAHHPDLLAAWEPLRRHITGSGALEPHHREMVILRVAHRCDSDYEWRHHVERGRRAGLSDLDIAAVRGPAGGRGSEPGPAVMTATDELLDTGSVTEDTWARLKATCSVEQILDLIVTVGFYRTLAMVIASTGVRFET